MRRPFFAFLFRFRFGRFGHLKFVRLKIQDRLVVTVEGDQINEDFSRGNTQGRERCIIPSVLILDCLRIRKK
jgi:hypothetical protein